MRIVADENIPFAREALGSLGEVTTVHGRAISAVLLRDVDALFVRSVTRVDADLLDGTGVRFVATATIGTDHVDEAYLRRRGIGFAYAPGCNANSVAEYVIAALLVIAERTSQRLEGKTIGIVGVGNVGSLVAAKAGALGMHVLRNDPPLARLSPEAGFVPIEELFDAEIITLHIPLTRTGPDSTFHMVDAAFLKRLRGNVILINTSRGAVADGPALLAARRTGRPFGLVLDVWENEPSIDPELLGSTDLASPHIAGYSLDGKVNGTFQIYSQACEFFGQPVQWDPASCMPPAEVPAIILPEGDDEDRVSRAVREVYSIEEDDRLLRGLVDMPEQERGPFFDNLRKTYRIRREFQNTTVTVPAGSPALAAKLDGIGFRVNRT